jgi:acetyl esterase/lipase
VTHRYGGDADQVADLYLPEGDGPFPVAVLIHGGFWRARFGRDLMHGACLDLQRHGIAAWNVEYRRLGTGGGWPASFEDVRTAASALATLDEGRIDLGRVALVGHSAGGHLALLAGAGGRCGGVGIAGVLGLAAVSDLELADRLGLGSGAVRERSAATSPRSRRPRPARCCPSVFVTSTCTAMRTTASRSR